MQFIDLKKQYKNYKKEIDEAIHRVLDHGHYVMGDEVVQCEEVLAEYVGTECCISVASGTDALVISLMALGISPGDEVITVPFTWISTAEAIALLGATPVFVDIEPETYNIDISKIEQAITPKTKAILPVSLFGQMPDYDAINAIAAEHGLTVIEDAAQSFGAERNGNRSCGVTKIAITSFFPAKPLGCYGDGGAIFTEDQSLAEKCRAIRNHGGLVRHHHTHLGLNGRFDTIQAAVILAKLPHFQREVVRRQEIGARYSNLLADCCVTPKIAEGNTHIYAQYTVRIEERDEVGARLKEKGVPTAIYYPKCLHEQPVFAPLGYSYGDFPVSEKAANEVLSLPMHPWLEEKELQEIAVHVKECCLAKL